MIRSLEAAVKKATRNRCLAYLTLSLLCVLYLKFFEQGALYSWLSGPEVVTESQLVEGEGQIPASSTISLEITGDSGEIGQLTTTEYGREQIKNRFLLAPVGNHLLLIKTGAEEFESAQFSGTLKSIPPGQRRAFLDPLTEEHPQLEGLVFPFELDTTDHGGFGAAIAAGVFIAGFAAIFMALWTYRTYRDPRRHALFSNLSVYGDPSELTEEIDGQLKANKLTRIGGATLCRDWIVFCAKSNVSVIPRADIVWMYLESSTLRYWFIPIGKVNKAVFETGHGVAMTIPGRKKVLANLLSEVSDRAPWAYVGYSDELHAVMRGPQRDDVLANVFHERDALTPS